jgi:FkbM family methyltransferase
MARRSSQNGAGGRSAANATLIYDVGLHDGTDAAYYLRLGFRVIAVEADAALVEAATMRFASEIDAGRLQIVNVGISATSGIARFWICDDHPEWSSFDREFASRDGCAHHAVRIHTVPFDKLLEEHGIPFYCKIDIEGNDELCLQAMRPGLCPPYLSMELSRRSSTEPLAVLRELGYQRFKVIDQTRFCSVQPRIHRILQARSPVGPVTRRLNRIARSRQSHAGWRFPLGSSGAIGPATPGRWLDLESVRDVCSWVEDHMQRTGLSEWFDLHAAL